MNGIARRPAPAAGLATGIAPALEIRPPLAQCHVTVQGPHHRVDLALPTGVPIVELTPTLALLCQAAVAAERESTPPAWSLARVGGRAFELTSTLAANGLLDGEVLHLTDVSSWQAPTISGMADGLAGMEDAGGPGWTGDARSALLAGAACLCLLAAAALAARSMAFSSATGGVALLIAAALAAGVYVPGLAGRRRAARSAIAVGAIAFGALAGWSLAGAGAGSGVTGAGLGAMVVAAALSIGEPVLAPGCALVAATVWVEAACVDRGVAAAQVAAVLEVLGVIALRAWPGVVSATLSVLFAESSPGLLEVAARRSRLILASLLGATALILVACGLQLLAHGGAFAGGLAGAGGLALLLRAQAYRRMQEALPAALGAAALMIAAVVTATFAIAADGRALLAVASLVAGGLGLAALAAPRTGLTLPYRAGRWAWLLVDAGVVPLALGVLGVYGLVGQLLHHVLHLSG